MLNKEQKIARWYFGGLASAGAACCTHPLDLLKVHLQTQQEGKTGIVSLTINIVKKQGKVAFCSFITSAQTLFTLNQILNVITIKLFDLLSNRQLIVLISLNLKLAD